MPKSTAPPTRRTYGGVCVPAGCRLGLAVLCLAVLAVGCSSSPPMQPIENKSPATLLDDPTVTIESVPNDDRSPVDDEREADENEADENEADENENEADENDNEADENEPDENENEPDENEADER